MLAPVPGPAGRSASGRGRQRLRQVSSAPLPLAGVNASPSVTMAVPLSESLAQKQWRHAVRGEAALLQNDLGTAAEHFADVVRQVDRELEQRTLRQVLPSWRIEAPTVYAIQRTLQRGAPRVIATDLDERALACAADNIAAIGCEVQVILVKADLFPPLDAFGKADLILCNPPWLPARPSSPLERAIYDPDSAMLRGFLTGLAAHLTEGGEGWLILSDLAEHLGLRSREELLGWVETAGLKVLGKRDIRPQHGKALDASDPLHAARSAEVTSLWRLGSTRL